MNEEFIMALNEIEREKGISKDIIFDALESALISSYRKNFGAECNVEVNMNRETGEIDLYSLQNIVEEPENPETEVSLEEARSFNSAYEIGDVLRKKLAPKNFGRIAAQTAKQVVIQRIKDAERDVIYEDFIDRENEIITGDVQRINNNNVFFDLGKTEAILPPGEQIRGEEYRRGNRYKLLITEVNRTTKGPQVVLSRSHPNLVRRLFELEVPEIHEGIVEIFSVAREAGSRTKIAVFSRDEEVDPLGACVGFKGNRVRTIVEELNGEKIDIVIYEKEIKRFIANALSPSKVVDVFINEEDKSALVVVPDFQLSLAIGNGGQNARLAAKVTNWKIDIKSEEQFEQYLTENGLTREDLQNQGGASVERLLSDDEIEESEMVSDDEEHDHLLEEEKEIALEDHDENDEEVEGLFNEDELLRLLEE